MKGNKIQVVLPDVLIEKFVKAAQKQNRSHSNLARLCIVDWLQREEQKEIKQA